MKGLGTGLAVVVRRKEGKRKAREKEGEKREKEGKQLERKKRVHSLLKVEKKREMKARLFFLLSFFFFPFVTSFSVRLLCSLVCSLAHSFNRIRSYSFVRCFSFVSATCSVMADQRQERSRKD
ncbi:hypothetical protein F5H01DRAFT_350691 [Linnemannia elongata]|nr:hypothetical protein F5H01DRAFT_350691 [Linnemannia elongata]